MEAVVYYGDGHVAYEPRWPDPGEGGLTASLKFRDAKITFTEEELAVIRPVAVGICGTDLAILAGEHGSAPPVVLGHEIVGFVEQVGSRVWHVRPGDFVGVDANVDCGVCSECRRGAKNRCVDLTTVGIFFDGGFAERCRLPGKQLIPLPEELAERPDRAALFEPAACIMHGLKQLPRALGERVLVVGAGPIGALFLFALRAANVPHISVLEQAPFRRDLIERLATISGQPFFFPDVGQHSYDAFDTVIDAAGNPSLTPFMVRVARAGGQVLLFGQQHEGATADAFPVVEANQKELAIVGSYATAYEFAETVTFLLREELPLEMLVTHQFPLVAYESAFQRMRDGSCMKVLLTPQGRLT